MKVRTSALLVVRVAGVLLGAFLVLSSLADIAGFLPHSTEPPSLGSRMLSGLPVLVGGIVFLVPFRFITRKSCWITLVSAYAGLSLLAVAKLSLGVGGYLAGNLHWAVIPVSVVLVVICIGSLVALFFQFPSGSSPETLLERGK